MYSPRRLSCCVLSLLCVASCGIEAPPGTGDEAAQVVVFVDVNVIPMDTDRVMEGQTVVVVDGRIKSVGDTAETEIPAGATRIEASGHDLIPALSDMHVDLEGDAWNGLFPPEEQFPPEALAAGYAVGR